MAVCEQNQNTHLAVTTLEENLKSMPVDMRIFSLTMRSLYSDKAVGGNNEVAIKFRKLRDNTRDDAMKYLQGVLPVCKDFVVSLTDFFDYYTDLDYDNWCESLSEIVENAKLFKQLANTVVKMHESLLVALKKREDDAKVIMLQFKDLQDKLDRKREELEQSAATKRGWAIVLAFIPYVNFIATPLLAVGAGNDMVEAVAKREESIVSEQAAAVVSNALMPALNNFIRGVKAAAGFFEVMETELEKFAKKGEKGGKRSHYVMMNGQANRINGYCRSFIAILPDIRADFKAIPTEGTDKSYVDAWLAQQKMEIRKSVDMPKLVERIMNAIAEK